MCWQAGEGGSGISGSGACLEQGTKQYVNRLRADSTAGVRGLELKAAVFLCMQQCGAVPTAGSRFSWLY
jgi:hypothetical protein